jgi:NACalpha-BTF3-like transcription factor
MDEFRKKQAEERIAADQEARLREQALQRGPGTLRLQGLTADSIQAETNLRNAQALELAGRQHEPRSLNEVDLAMLAASDGPEAEQAQRALVNLGKGPHADKLPTSYDTLVLASELEDNPITKAKYDAAISHIERFRARPTKTESEADQDRITERDTKLVTAQAIAANGGDEPKALAFLVRTLANADANKLSRHEREVTAGAIMTLRHKPNPLADAINAALEKAQQQTGK